MRWQIPRSSRKSWESKSHVCDWRKPKHKLRIRSCCLWVYCACEMRDPHCGNMRNCDNIAFFKTLAVFVTVVLKLANAQIAELIKRKESRFLHELLNSGLKVWLLFGVTCNCSFRKLIIGAEQAISFGFLKKGLCFNKCLLNSHSVKQKQRHPHLNKTTLILSRMSFLPEIRPGAKCEAGWNRKANLTGVAFSDWIA